MSKVSLIRIFLSSGCSPTLGLWNSQSVCFLVLKKSFNCEWNQIRVYLRFDILLSVALVWVVRGLQPAMMIRIPSQSLPDNSPSLCLSIDSVLRNLFSGGPSLQTQPSFKRILSPSISHQRFIHQLKEKEIVPSLVCRLHKHWISSNWRYCKLHLIVRNSFLPPARTEQTGNSQKLEKLMKSWKLITGGDWSLN